WLKRREETVGSPSSPRAALQDLLAYRRAFDPVLSLSPCLYGVGVAWSERLDSPAGAEVVLCTPDSLLLRRRSVGDPMQSIPQNSECYQQTFTQLACAMNLGASSRNPARAARRNAAAPVV